jgi:type IV pilus assembly protein PilC
MPTFDYIARDAQGRTQRGSDEAASPDAMAAKVRGRGLTVLDIMPRSSERSWTTQLAEFHPTAWLPVRSLDVELSLQQLAVMLRGGLTLLSAMQLLVELAHRGAMRRTWQRVVRQVQGGSALADALAVETCFPPLVVQLVRIGEQTGHLEPVLRRGAEAMERRRQLRNSLLLALAYPALVLVSSLGVTAFMVYSVIPKLEAFLKNLGRSLPPLTQLLLDISTNVRTGLPYATLALIVGLVVFMTVYWWPRGRYMIDRALLRLPVVGYILRLAATALAARSLSILLRSGVTLLEGLRTMEQLHGNHYLRRRLAQARARVMDGDSLAVALRDPQAYLPLLLNMIAVGESAGTLDEVLEETARFEEDQLEATLRRLSALVEPLILVGVGGVVGFVYIAFFLALFAAAGSAN